MEVHERDGVKRTFTRAPWESQVGYCRAIRMGDTIAVTGTTSVDSTGSVIGPNDAYLQAKTCLEIIERSLIALGAGKRNILRTRLFVTDISRWREFGRAHAEFFADHPPTTSMIEVKGLIDPQLLVEIEADAIASVITIKTVSPLDLDVQTMIAALNQYNLSHYTATACHLDPPSVLAQDNCTMFGAFDGQKLIGIGAVKFFSDYGEIKRMFISPDYRGRRLSHLILDRLLVLIRERHLPFARLETGEKFCAAVSLYRKKGFQKRRAFGDYPDTPESLFMELRLQR